MPTKKELEKDIVELKQIIRELRRGIKKHVPTEDDLPISTFCVTKKGREYWHYELRLNHENDEIMVKSKKKIRTRDFAIAYHRSQKHLLYQLLGEDKKRQALLEEKR